MSSFWYAYDMAEKILGSDYRAYELFSPKHFLMLGIFAAICVVAAIFYRRADFEHRSRVLKIRAVLMLVDEAVKYFGALSTGQWSWIFLPLHLCSINIFVCTWHAFTKSRLAEQIIYALCLPGALVALLMPTWTGLPFLNLMHLHSMTVHMLLALYPILLLAGGMKPDYRQLPKIFGLLVAFCLPVFFVNKWLGTNFFFLNGTNGNPLLEFLAGILGENFYFLGLPFVLMLAWVVMYLPWELKARCKARG